MQASQPAQAAQQKVTYAPAQLQPGIKQQFYAAPMAPAQKAGGPQQIQVRRRRLHTRKCQATPLLRFRCRARSESRFFTRRSLNCRR